MKKLASVNWAKIELRVRGRVRDRVWGRVRGRVWGRVGRTAQ